MATPKGWRTRKIGELASLRRGLTWKKDQERETSARGTVPVLRIPNVQTRLDLGELLHLDGVSIEDRARFRAARGYSLLVGSNGNAKRVGNCVFIDEPMDFVFASFLIAASPTNESEVDPAYLYRILASERVQDAISESVQGSTGLKNISLMDVRGYEVRLPPLAEQRKIVAILSSIDETIEKTEAVIEQLQVVKKAMMQELLTRGMPGRHTRFKQTEIGEIPEGWEVVELDTLVESGRPICYGVLKPGPHVQGGIPVVRVTDYRGDVIDLRNVQSSAPSIVAPFHRSTLRGGDLLISIRGTAGRMARVPRELTGGNISRDSARISLADPALQEWVFFYLRSQVAQDFVLGEMRGMAVRGINIADLRRLPVPLPPEEERDVIVSILSSQDERLLAELGSQNSACSLKKSLSAALLTGDLRVIADETTP